MMHEKCGTMQTSKWGSTNPPPNLRSTGYQGTSSADKVRSAVVSPHEYQEGLGHSTVHRLGQDMRRSHSQTEGHSFHTCH